MLCVVCYRNLPEVRELFGVQYVVCICGVRYSAVMIHAFHTNPGVRARWRQVLRRDGWTVQYDRATGEVVVTNG